MPRQKKNKKNNLNGFNFSDEMKDTFLNLSPDLICIAGMEGYFKYVNPAWEKLLGYSETELLSKPFLDFIHPDDHAKNDEEVSYLSKGETSLNFENRYICKNGSIKHIHWTATPLLTEKAMYCIGRDITERKQAEENLIKARELAEISESEFQKTLGLVHIGIWFLDIETNQVTWSEELYKMYGFDPALPVPPYTEHMKLFTPESWDILSTSLENTRKTGIAYDLELRTIKNDGNSGWMWVRGEAIQNTEGKITALWGTAQDITKRKQAEEALKGSEERLKTILDTSPFPIAVVDLNDENILYWSKTAIQLFGHNPKTVREWYELAYPDPDYRQDVIKRWKPFIEKAQDSVEAVNTGEYQIVCKNGTIKICELYAQLIPGNLIVTLNDITERKRAENDKMLITKRLQISTESAHIGIWDLNIKNNTLIWDKQMFELYGIQPVDFGGAYEAWKKGVHPDDFLQTDADIQDAIAGKKDFHSQFRVVWQDGQIRSIEAHAVVISDSAGIPERMIGVNRDITEREEAENQLKISLKEKEILLQEIYHRTKNNMQVISSMLRLRARSLNNPQINEVFDEMVNSIRGMALVHQKLYESGDLSHLNLKDYISGVVQILRKSTLLSLKKIDVDIKGVNIEVSLDTAMPIGLIINEIVTNAIKHAFPDEREGKIEITLNITPQNEIKLAISDNGKGLPENFNPNTDKGFGMQTIIDLVEYQLRGSISLKSYKGLHYQIVIKEKVYDARI